MKILPRILILPVLFSVFLMLVGCSDKKPLPVSIRWRDAALSSTKVAIVARTDYPRDEPIRVIVEWTDSSTGERRWKAVELMGERHFGHMEGFRFLKGDVIKISNQNFQAVTSTCP